MRVPLRQRARRRITDARIDSGTPNRSKGAMGTMSSERVRNALRGAAACGIAALGSLAVASQAAALEDCAQMPQVKVLHSGAGKLESVAVDRRGHVFFTDSDAGQLLRLRTDGRPPRVLASGIDGPGGIVF